MAEDFTLKGKVVLDTTGLAQPTQDTKALTGEFTNLFGGISTSTAALGAMGLAAVGLGQAVRSLTDDAYEAYNEFERLGWVIGVSASEMAKWSQVAHYADSTGESLANMLGKMSVNLADTGPGGEKARQVLTDMGIAVYDANGNIRDLTDIFPEFVDGIDKINDVSVRNGAAMDVMGKGYKDLAGYTLLGADGIRKVYEETNTLNAKQQEDLAALETKWKDLNRVMTENQMILGAELAPAVWELVDAVQTLMNIDDGKFFRDMVAGVELAVDAFKVLVRGLTLTIIALEYIQALTRGDFAGAEAIRQKGAEYVSKYTAADNADDFASAWSDAGGKSGSKEVGAGGKSAKQLAEEAAAAKSGSDKTKFGAAAYTDAEIGAMATRNGVSVETVIARLNLAGEANKYGVSTSQVNGKYVPTATPGMTASDTAMYNDLQASFAGQSGRNEGMWSGVYGENIARYNANLKFARADTTGDTNLSAIKELETHLTNPLNGTRFNENYGYGSGTYASTSDDYMAAYMKQFEAPKVTIINYNYGSSSPEEIANATAEATSRELARQAAL